jgi:type I restriction enzyme M protein
MQNNTREIERQNLYKSLWDIATSCRGKIDGWDFKNYIFGFMFYRYLSEKITDYINNYTEDGFDYTTFDDTKVTFRATIVDDLGYFIYPSQLFCNVAKNANENENLNTTLHDIFKSIENSAVGNKAEAAFLGLFDDVDVNSKKLGATVTEKNKLLAKVISGINVLDFKYNEEGEADILGDAYEYLMGHFAANAGKGGGEYYTPPEVSTLLTKLGTVGKEKVDNVYDPTCGSGSLLLKSRKVLGTDNVGSFYGQENNLMTYNLARMNMFLHGVDFNRFDIVCGDTLANPQHTEQQFELIVSNPPYSVVWEGKKNPQNIHDPRFSVAGALAPDSKADFAFIMHMLSQLRNDGVASIVCFPGIFYRSGAEQKIRQYLIDNNFVDCIIQLPENLFYGTSISTCILVLKKNKTTRDVLFINASDECVKVTNSNKLSDNNIDNILKMFTDRKDIQYVTKLVSNKDIEKEKYNLSVNTYVEQKSTMEEIDIDVLNKEINTTVERINELRSEINDIIDELNKDKEEKENE